MLRMDLGRGGQGEKIMLLTININNTNTMLGLFHNQKWIANWRVSSDRAKLVDEYGMLLKNLFDFEGYKWEDISAVAIASVVPPLTTTFTDMSRRFFKRDPLVVSHEINLGVKVRAGARHCGRSIVQPHGQITAHRIGGAARGHRFQHDPMHAVRTCAGLCGVDRRPGGTHPCGTRRTGPGHRHRGAGTGVGQRNKGHRSRRSNADP